MAVRESLARLFGAKASIIGLSADELPDRALEKSYDDAALLSTYADDAWPYILANKIGEQASQAPLQVGTEDKDGEFKPVGPNHPVQGLFDNPNPLYDGGEFIHLLMLYMELAGHSPVEFVQPNGGGIIGAPGRTGRRKRDGFELWLHNPSQWRIVGNADGSIKGYLWLATSADDLKWLPSQMTYLRWPNPNNRWYGQGRIQAIRQQVMAEEYAAIRDKKFEKNLGVPPGILSSEMPLGDPTAEMLQKRWEKAVGGYQNAGKIAILGSKTTYQPITMSARDAEWLKQRQARIEVLAAGFGVPMPMILMQDAKFANAQEARAEFWEGTLQPRLNRIARMLTMRVIPLVTTEPLICRFDYSKIEALGENDLEAAQTATAWANTGSVSVDEVRHRLGLEPHKDTKFGERMLIPTTIGLQAADEIAANAQMGLEGAQAAIDATRNPPKAEEDRPPRRRSVKADVKREDLLAPVIDGFKRDLSGYFLAQRGALNGAFKAMPREEAEEIIRRAIEIITAKRWRDRIARISRLPIETGLTLGASEAATRLGISVTFSIPASEAALQQVTGHLDRLGVGIQNTTNADVRRVLTDALREGVDNTAIRGRLDELFDGYQDWRLDRISRSEVTSAYNLGAIGQYKEAGVQTVLVSDGDVDAPCAAANGARWTLDHAESDPLAHPNCFIGSQSVIAPNLRASFARWFDGEVISVKTASGHELTATPNHPVLTGSGWTALSVLREGDYLIRSLDHERVARLVDPHHDHVEARIAEIAEALPVIAPSVPSSAEDFHGDAADGDIYVVRTNGALDDRVESAFAQPAGKGAGGGRYIAAQPTLTTASPAGEIIRRASHAADGIVGGLTHTHSERRITAVPVARGRGSALGRQATPSPAGSQHTADNTDLGSQRVGRFTGQVAVVEHRPIDRQSSAPTSGPDAGSVKQAPHRREADTERGGDLLAGFTGLVALDEIVHIERRQFAGHVYNLETEQGWYLADSILTHNCTRTWIPDTEGL